MASPQVHLASLDEHALASRAVSGDRQAFAALYDRHGPRIYGFCLHLLCSGHDAADATQETFIRLLQRLPAMSGQEVNFIAYALRTARNVCYDMIEVARRVSPVEETPEGAAEDPADADVQPERSLLLSAQREDVRRACAALPARQREVLALREVEGLSYAEIAAIIGIKPNAVAQLISRARIGLRDLLRGGALHSVQARSPECARALPLLARTQDGDDPALEELEWLCGHVASCDSCRLNRSA
ncbi:MAG: RNA polymerase sigma factor, partial [Solirubrobacteraceae bacterium]